jgi:hypothetical protein
VDAADGDDVETSVEFGDVAGVAEPPSGTGEPHKDTRTTMAGVRAMNSRTMD